MSMLESIKKQLICLENYVLSDMEKTDQIHKGLEMVLDGYVPPLFSADIDPMIEAISLGIDQQMYFLFGNAKLGVKKSKEDLDYFVYEVLYSSGTGMYKIDGKEYSFKNALEFFDMLVAYNKHIYRNSEARNLNDKDSREELKELKESYNVLYERISKIDSFYQQRLNDLAKSFSDIYNREALEEVVKILYMIRSVIPTPNGGLLELNVNNLTKIINSMEKFSIILNNGQFWRS